MGGPRALGPAERQGLINGFGVLAWLLYFLYDAIFPVSLYKTLDYGIVYITGGTRNGQGP